MFGCKAAKLFQNPKSQELSLRLSMPSMPVDNALGGFWLVEALLRFHVAVSACTLGCRDHRYSGVTS